MRYPGPVLYAALFLIFSSLCALFAGPAGKEPEAGEMAGITRAHNETRRALKIPDLKWSPEIAKFAQQWADTLKSTRNCKMAHSPMDTRPYGENLAWASGKKLTPADVVRLWSREAVDYNYDTGECAEGKLCGHYTQLVWRETERVGCALARCENSEVWVCHYDPPGNYVGEKPY